MGDVQIEYGSIDIDNGLFWKTLFQNEDTYKLIGLRVDWESSDGIGDYLHIWVEYEDEDYLETFKPLNDKYIEIFEPIFIQKHNEWFGVEEPFLDSLGDVSVLDSYSNFMDECF